MWILMLVFIAGVLNTAGWLQYGQTLSHMTGNLTRLGLSITGRDGKAFALLLVCLLSFFLGATLSGYSFPEHRVGLWRRSGVVLMISGALLMLAEALPFPREVRVAALALVLGAQNGLALRYRGILTRTTHMTGHLTDCGAALGRMIHAQSPHGENLRLFLFHFLCLWFFLFGVVMAALSATWLEHNFSLDVIELGALCYLLAGAGNFLQGAACAPGRRIILSLYDRNIMRRCYGCRNNKKAAWRSFLRRLRLCKSALKPAAVFMPVPSLCRLYRLY